MDHPARADVVVIVSANAEWNAIEPVFSGAALHWSPLGKWFQALIGDHDLPVLFFHGGWGKIAAAAATEYVIHHAAPSLLVNLGTCGGIRGSVAAGEVILVERTVVYDIHEQMGDPAEHLSHYATAIDLHWLDRPCPHKVVPSLMVSGDRDLMPADIPRLKRDFGAIVADWESASIAWVAQRHGVRTLILRGVSDLVDETRGEAYDGNSHHFVQNTQQIMERLVSQLPDWINASGVRREAK